MQKLQKTAVRFIDLVPPYTSTEQIFNKYSLMTVENIYIYNIVIGTITYRFRNALLPKCIEYMYKVNTTVHRHDTHQSSYYHVPTSPTNQSSS